MFIYFIFFKYSFLALDGGLEEGLGAKKLFRISAPFSFRKNIAGIVKSLRAICHVAMIKKYM